MARPRRRKTRPTRATKNFKRPPTRETIARKPLAKQVIRVIAEKGISQAAAGAVVGEQQSQISLVSSGRLEGFSPERLIRMLTRLGRDVEIHIRPTGKPRAGRVRVVVGRAKRARGK